MPLADDAFVAAEGRREEFRMQVRGVLVHASAARFLFEFADARFEPDGRARVEVLQLAHDEPVDPVLALDDGLHPPAQQPDEPAANERDERRERAARRPRVVAHLRAEIGRQNGERIGELINEERRAARQRRLEHGVDLGSIHARFTLAAHALAYLRYDGVDVDGCAHRAAILGL